MESTQGLPLEVRLSAYLDGQLSHTEIREIDVMLARVERGAEVSENEIHNRGYEERVQFWKTQLEHYFEWFYDKKAQTVDDLRWRIAYPDFYGGRGKGTVGVTYEVPPTSSTARPLGKPIMEAGRLFGFHGEAQVVVGKPVKTAAEALAVLRALASAIARRSRRSA